MLQVRKVSIFAHQTIFQNFFKIEFFLVVLNLFVNVIETCRAKHGLSAKNILILNHLQENF